MAIFRSIGNAFKDGWNKNNRQSRYSVSNQVESEGYAQYMDTKDYANNITNSSFLSVVNIDSTNKDNTVNLDTVSDYSGSYFENNFKIPSYILNQVSNNYKFIYEQASKQIIDFGFDEKNKGDDKKIDYIGVEMPAIPSMFNPLFGINIVGITGNTPLIDTTDEPKENVKSSFGNSFVLNTNVSDYIDTHDCSINTLVSLSNKGLMGREIYKYADFMYCKKLGKFANNRLITLRKFPIPIGDDISSSSSNPNDGKPNIPGDIGRLVCWMDEDNKLEDILKYDYHETWKEETGEWEEVDSREGNENRGILGSFINLANPKYRKQVAGGWQSGGNMILDRFAGSIFNGQLLSAEGTNFTDNSKILTMYDNHKVYYPKGVIRKTNLYEGTLEFNHSFTLIFDYELRAYEHINPKTALLDLLNNIYQVTYRTGKFWGGDIWWVGSPQNKRGWETADAFISASFEKLEGTAYALLRGNLNVGDLLGNMANKLAQAAKTGLNAIAQTLTDEEYRKNVGETAAQILSDANIFGMLEGMFKNKFGRPAIYATQTLLTGDPVGLWHVTIGNPRNPILSIGNLIIESSSIQHYGPLGFDDFPTGLKLTVNLKHARPRDMIELGKMYTGGKTGLAIPLSKGAWEDYLKPNVEADKFNVMWASTTPPVTEGQSYKKNN